MQFQNIPLQVLQIQFDVPSSLPICLLHWLMVKRVCGAMSRLTCEMIANSDASAVGLSMRYCRSKHALYLALEVLCICSNVFDHFQ